MPEIPGPTQTMIIRNSKGELLATIFVETLPNNTCLLRGTDKDGEPIRDENGAEWVAVADGPLRWEITDPQ